FLGVVGSNQFVCAADPDHADQPIVPPTQAISRLKQGNERYTRGNPQHPHESIDERTRLATNSYENASLIFPDMTKRREELAKSQHPFAVVLGCSDSRVPPEIVFDQGLGDLFVVREAGNVIDDHSLGSIEYAVDHLAVRLIVVLGHQRCGAVKAAKETLAAKTEAPAHIQSLVTAIQPAVEETTKGDLDATIEAYVPGRLDRMPWSRWHWLIVVSLGATWILDGLEVTLAGSLGGILTRRETLGLTDTQVGASATFYLAGAVLGALLFGYGTDRLSRKKLFFVTVAVYLVVAGLTAISWNFA